MMKQTTALIFSGTVALAGVILMLLARSCTMAQLGLLDMGMMEWSEHNINPYYKMITTDLAHPYIVTYITFLLIGAAILIVGLVGIIATLLRGEAK